nr:PepSY-associated TM helix domain-containing protein [uncultured Microbulbifer sp.]
MPFHLLIDFTAFVFAFYDPLFEALQLVVYGDIAMFTRPPAQKVRSPSDLATIAELERAVQAREPEFQLAVIIFMNLDSTNPRIRIGGPIEGYIVRGAEYAYAVDNPFTAQVPYSSILPNHVNGYSGIVVSLFIFHFGSFGSKPVRWIYFSLGIMGALIFLSGNLLWIKFRRRKHRDRECIPAQVNASVPMTRLTVGVCLGTVLGFAMCILAAKWLPHWQVDIGFWQHAAYYAGFMVAIFWSFFRRPVIAARELLLLTSIGVLLIPLSEILTFTLNNTITLWPVEMSALLVGFCC